MGWWSGWADMGGVLWCSESERPLRARSHPLTASMSSFTSLLSHKWDLCVHSDMSNTALLQSVHTAMLGIDYSVLHSAVFERRTLTARTPDSE